MLSLSCCTLFGYFYHDLGDFFILIFAFHVKRWTNIWKILTDHLKLLKLANSSLWQGERCCYCLRKRLNNSRFRIFRSYEFALSLTVLGVCGNYTEIFWLYLSNLSLLDNFIIFFFLALKLNKGVKYINIVHYFIALHMFNQIYCRR